MSTTQYEENLQITAAYAMLVFSLMLSYFYLTYVIREGFDIVSEGSAQDLSDFGSLFNQVALALLVSLGSGCFAVYRIRKPVIAIASPGVQHRDSMQTALFILALMPVIALGYLSRGASYEEVHAITGRSWWGRCLYTIYLYHGFVLAKYVKQGKLDRQLVLESLFLNATIILALPFRSLVLMNILTLVLIGKPPLKRLGLFALASAAIFLFTSIWREDGAHFGSGNAMLHLMMFLFGASLQIDLYAVALHYSTANYEEIRALLAPLFGDYFDSGGGLGSFIAIELGHIFPLHATLYLAALLPVLLLLLARLNPLLASLAVIAGVQCFSIIRNPAPSWLSGFIFMTAIFYYVHTKRNPF